MKKLREGFDLKALELDRDEAPLLAMFDDSKEGILARKYDAANERSMYRALRELREIPTPPPEDEAPIAEVDAIPQLEADPNVELGSFFPEPPDVELAETNVDPIIPKSPVEVVSRTEKEPSPRRLRG